MIKVILKPTVAVISRPEFVEHPQYKVPPDGDPATRLGAFSAKGCYDSFGEDGRACEKNQRSILEHRHGSVLEHIHYGLFIEGITRSLTLELNRHRTFNISQRSTRYVAEEDSAIVLEPYYAQLFLKYNPILSDTHFVGNHILRYVRSNEEKLEESLLLNYLNAHLESIQVYKKQVQVLMNHNPNDLEGFDLRKWARGKARNVLPHGIETRGTWTNNVRGWRWFVEARSNRHAEPEIRRLAEEVLHTLHAEAPVYFEDFFNNVHVIDGIGEYTPEYSKV